MAALQSMNTQVFKACKLACRPQARMPMAVRAMASKADTIKTTVADNKVVVYSKTYCPYCSTVKGLFEDLTVPTTVFELDRMSDGAEWQDTLSTLTGRRTVPQVFVGGKFIGGCDDTMDAYNAGKLKGYLAEAGVSIK